MAESVASFVKGVMKNTARSGTDIQTKLLDKTLVLDAFRPDTTLKREQRQEKRRREKTMSSRERKQRRLYDVPPELHNYQFFLPLHQLWKQYTEELLGANPIASASRLLKADFNGAILKVTEAKCVSYFGITGIVIQETTSTFRMITPDNQMKTVPKLGNVFTFQINEAVFTLYGQNFIYRPAERTARKIKAKGAAA